MPDDHLPTQILTRTRLLTDGNFHRVSDVPAEVQWFATLTARARGAPTRTLCGTLSA
jgi:hypothetical protein